MSVSGSDDSDSGLPASTDPVPAAMRPKPSSGKRPICPRCHKGFHIQRNLHVKCSICQTLLHRRCIRKADSFDGADSLVCQKCDRPSTRSRAEQGIPSAGGERGNPSAAPQQRNLPSAGGEQGIPPAVPQQGNSENIISIPVPAEWSVLEHPDGGGELLLHEESDELQVGGKQNFLDCRTQLDVRLATLGFKRSESQPDTPADGDCALHGKNSVCFFLSQMLFSAILDGYLNHTQNDFLEKTDTALLRYLSSGLFKCDGILFEGRCQFTSSEKPFRIQAPQ